MSGHLIKFKSKRIKSRLGFKRWITGKAGYIVRGGGTEVTTYEELKNGEKWYCPTIICSNNYKSGTPQHNEMLNLIDDYINDGWDGKYTNHENKLKDALKWKKEQLIMYGIDFSKASNRKVWQDRGDLLTDTEKDDIISEWEAS